MCIALPPRLTRYMSFSLRFLGLDLRFRAFITRLEAGSRKCWLKASNKLRKESANWSWKSSGGGLSIPSTRNKMKSTFHRSWKREEVDRGWGTGREGGRGKEGGKRGVERVRERGEEGERARERGGKGRGSRRVREVGRK